MAHLPIEISYQKLHDWLQSRSSRLSVEHPSEFEELLKAAPLLTQLARHDIPGVRRATQKNEQTMTYCNKKERETTNSIKESTKKLLQYCEELGIDQNEADLAEAVRTAPHRKLPEFHRDIVKSIKDLSQGVQTYTKASGTDFTPLLSYITEHGNPTIREYKKHCGEDIADMKNEPSLNNQPATGSDDDDIDWGDFGVEDANADAQDDESSQSSDPVADPCPNTVNYDILILSDQGIIQTLTDELYELRAFLTQRVAEAQNDSQFSDCATDILCVNAWVDLINAIIATCSSKLFQELLLMLDSDLYCANKTRELVHKKHEISRLNSVLSELSLRQAAAADNLADGTEELDNLIEEVEKLKSQIEGILRKWYAPREVFLTGGLNRL
eukprot:TRINITY_DN11560_c0_g1_i3.p1 TRINITY_DN11560_c0_g1~~TRINITY_DN11560_c0_g1_i3.p1  ORF type:complete len:402 (+),score=69.54 TRINITY_DN11560_c0_g1_i3:52-1206(+)